MTQKECKGKVKSVFFFIQNQMESKDKMEMETFFFFVSVDKRYIMIHLI